MSLRVGTHWGVFHADDVLAWSLIKEFVDPEAQLLRSRESEVLEQMDLLIDVGGVYDPQTLRFDHHQHSYTGSRSSAGMILDWLESEGRVSAELAEVLRDQLVDYVDDVDNGRRELLPEVPCFPKLIAGMNEGCEGLEAFDKAFHEAAAFAQRVVVNITRNVQSRVKARGILRQQMQEAEQRGSNLLVIQRHLDWKPIYFELGGREHPTEFILYPGIDGSWRVQCIPPVLGSFDKKRPLPLPWAGLKDEELSAVVGIEGCVFCHKNQFIAVFRSREVALSALQSWDLLQGELP